MIKTLYNSNLEIIHINNIIINTTFYKYILLLYINVSYTFTCTNNEHFLLGGGGGGGCSTIFFPIA